MCFVKASCAVRPVTISKSELFLAPSECTSAPTHTWSSRQDGDIVVTVISGEKPSHIKSRADPWIKAWNNHKKAGEFLARNNEAHAV